MVALASLSHVLSLSLSLRQEFGEAAAVLAFVAIMQCGP